MRINPQQGTTATHPGRLLIVGLTTCCFIAVMLSTSSSAHADQTKYVGGHPIGHADYCYIEAPHVHAYAPRNASVLYRTHDGHHYFIGDPVAHKYDGPKHAYRGHHPVSVTVALGDDHHGDDDHVEFCYLSGSHYHAYAPPPRAHFKLKGGVYWYTGAFAPRYRTERARRVRINVVYKRIKYRRPVVTVTPPVGYVVPVLEVRGKVRAKHRRPHVGASVGVGVQVRVPSVHIDVGLPGAVIVDHRPGYRRGHRHKRYKRKHYKRKHYKRKHYKRKHYKRKHYKRKHYKKRWRY